MIDDVSCMLLLQRSHREFHVFGQKNVTLFRHMVKLEMRRIPFDIVGLLYEKHSI